MDIDIKVLYGQMGSFLILIFCGFLAVKVKLVSREVLNGLSKLMMAVVVPALILTTLPGAKGADSAFLILPMTVGGFVLFGLFMLLGYLTALALRLKGDFRSVHIGEATFGNLGFFGIPLAAALLGPEGTMALSLFAIADNTLLWTFGVWLSTGKEQKAQGVGSKVSLTLALKKLVNPATIAVAAGLILLAMRISTDTLPLKAVGLIGSCAKPLALFYIGAISR